MPECHKCSHDGNPTRDCLRCKGPSEKPNDHRRGHSTVSRDSSSADNGADSVAFGEELADTRAINVNTSVSLNLSDCCADAVQRLLAVLGEIEDTDRNFLFARMRGETLEQIGKRNNMSKQWISECMKRIASEHPELKGALSAR